MQIISPGKVHPVIVIGSGASGGMAAWNLTRQGIDVLLLDAGDKFDRAKFWTHVQPWEAQERAARGERPPQFFLDTQGAALRHAGRPAVRADARLGARRQDQRLGARQPALLADGSQGGRAGRLGDPLADRLRRHRALLRPGRAADRRLRRHRRLGGAARAASSCSRRPRRGAASGCCRTG